MGRNPGVQFRCSFCHHLSITAGGQSKALGVFCQLCWNRGKNPNTKFYELTFSLLQDVDFPAVTVAPVQTSYNSIGQQHHQTPLEKIQLEALNLLTLRCVDPEAGRQCLGQVENLRRVFFPLIEQTVGYKFWLTEFRQIQPEYLQELMFVRAMALQHVLSGSYLLLGDLFDTIRWMIEEQGLLTVAEEDLARLAIDTFGLNQALTKEKVSNFINAKGTEIRSKPPEFKRSLCETNDCVGPL